MILNNEKEKHINWTKLLYNESYSNYELPNIHYDEQIRNIINLINDSQAILIGAGAGLSTAAGIEYSGKRFDDNFKEFIEKYGKQSMPNMYVAGFYPFKTEEEKWGYWSKHALMNRFYPPALDLYKDLYDIVKNKNYFVITTNVDGQFFKSGFSKERIFAPQGDYGFIQCKNNCHQKIYYAKKLFFKMDKKRKNCLIPTSLVPKCPVCKGPMNMHLRCDDHFTQDEKWYISANRYSDFINKNKSKKVLLLELGVGFNTPMIIRFPFEKMLIDNHSYSLVRLNKDNAKIPKVFNEKAIGIEKDMSSVIKDIKEFLNDTKRKKRIFN